MPRICKICAHPDQAAVTAAFATDASDRELARQFGVSHMAVGRHRRQHIVKPMQAAARALDRGRTDRQKREQQLAAVEKGDAVAIVAASLSYEALAAERQRVSERCERMAALAEASQSPQGVAALSAQQFRGIETGARLAGLGGYAPTRATDQAEPRQTFSVSIIFSGGKTTTINTLLDTNRIPVIDAQQEIDGYEDAGVTDADAVADELPRTPIWHDIQEIDEC
jgi:hypothetical protein